MDREDFKRAAMLIMLLVLAYTAPQWMQPGKAQQSNYDAPWVYPGLAPQAGK